MVKSFQEGPGLSFFFSLFFLLACVNTVSAQLVPPCVSGLA